MELEEGEKGLIYDRGAWLELNKLVDLADQYNVPLTIMFWPTAVDVILDDPKKIEAVKSWQAAGHEIGIHIQYDGQGNFNPDNLSRYRKLLDFSYQTEIKSGTIVNKDMNTPQETIYDVDGRVVGDALGGDPHQDGRTSKAIVNSFNNHLTYRINARAGYLDPRTKELEYNSLEPDEIYGVGLHPVDILQDPKIIENWFKFLHDKDPQGIKRMTVSGLMESYVILNNLTGTLSGMVRNEPQDPAKKTIMIVRKKIMVWVNTRADAIVVLRMRYIFWGKKSAKKKNTPLFHSNP
ncbi:MAG: hypothetical protein B6U97_02620 [Candidatus Altiarchaeales archaeon ex4484_96]|nr:MAG: hypothetical protein B6U97_02620 [Candidatus Altiarchaeales archaeon ex4484_96]